MKKCRHPEHADARVEPLHGWILTADEAWLPAEWDSHARPPLSEEERHVRDRERKRAKYATDPEYREAQRERVRRNDAKRRAA